MEAEREFSAIDRTLRAFLCHASGDKAAVRELYGRLRHQGVDPWLDSENLLPGQEWEREISAAVRSSDVIVVCLSQKSIAKTGFVQKELKHALDVAAEQPEGSIFIVPACFEACDVPESLRRWQWVNLFEKNGFERLVRALQHRANTLGLAPVRPPILASPVMNIAGQATDQTTASPHRRSILSELRAQEFVVRPRMPASLRRLPELAYNLLWSWDATILDVFLHFGESRALFPENPVSLLQHLSSSALEAAGADQSFRALYDKACRRLDEYLQKAESRSEQSPIAFFSAQYAVAEFLPTYIGDQGIFAGDHVKACSDLGIPVIAVGLLYRWGGTQLMVSRKRLIEPFTDIDMDSIPLSPACGVDGRELRIPIRLGDGTFNVRVWQVRVGKTNLYLLDSNLRENEVAYRATTEVLDPFDRDVQVKQGIVLGIPSVSI